MEYGYYKQTGNPLRGRSLEELKGFLLEMGLTYDEGIQFTALIRDGEGQIIAAASLQENVIKCVAVDSRHQGEGLTATVLTVIRQEALARGQRHLFLYTKPENHLQFFGLGFHEVIRTGGVLLMEDRRGGFDRWIESVRRPEAAGIIGAAVMNCNPMTLGHRYLIEQAAARCDFLYLFIVSEDKSAVPAEARRQIVEQAVSDLPHVVMVGTERYLISSATFPDYFLKDKSRSAAVWTELDVALFCRAAKALGITKRFVGTEPFCSVTAAYNQALKATLPENGVELLEIPRLEQKGVAISATAVRAMIADGRWQELEGLTPQATWDYFNQPENREIFLARYSYAK